MPICRGVIDTFALGARSMNPHVTISGAFNPDLKALASDTGDVHGANFSSDPLGIEHKPMTFRPTKYLRIDVAIGHTRTVPRSTAAIQLL